MVDWLILSLCHSLPVEAEVRQELVAGVLLEDDLHELPHPPLVRRGRRRLLLLAEPAEPLRGHGLLETARGRHERRILLDGRNLHRAAAAGALWVFRVSKSCFYVGFVRRTTSFFFEEPAMFCVMQGECVFDVF